MFVRRRTQTHVIRYLMAPGVYGTFSVLTARMANNSEPHYRRATTIALNTIAGNAGGILSTWSFPTKEGPKFRKTTIMTLIFFILVAVCALTNMTYLSWRNKRKKHPEIRPRLLQKYVPDEKEEDRRLRAWTELGDRHPDFVYTL